MLLTTSWLEDILIFSTLLFALFYWYATRKFNYWKKRGIPYKEPVPFFGTLTDVFKMKTSIGEYFRDLYFGTQTPYTGIFIMGEPALFVKDRELIKSILVKDFNYFYDRPSAADNKHDPLGSQILFHMKNPDWSFYRKKMTPAYTSGKVKYMYPLITEAGSDLLKFLAKLTEKNDIVDAKKTALLYTTELITSTAFGIKANCFEDEKSEFRLATSRIFDFNNIIRGVSTTCYIIAPTLVNIFRLKFVDPQSASFLRSVFWKTIENREKSNTGRHDFIDILLQIRKDDKLNKVNDLDGDKMLAQAMIFFLAGFETTSSTISFALYELAKHQDIQNKLRKELQNVIEIEGNITYESVSKKSENLKLLEQVFKETLRLYPAVPNLIRQCVQDYRIPGTDHVIEKGMGIHISSLGLSMDPENFENPEEFDPERFSEENIRNVKQFTYLPFGEGPRNCLGDRFGAISSKTALAQIIANFQVDLHEDTPLKMSFHPRGFLLAPKSGKLLLRFKKI